MVSAHSSHSILYFLLAYLTHPLEFLSSTRIYPAFLCNIRPCLHICEVLCGENQYLFKGILGARVCLHWICPIVRSPAIPGPQYEENFSIEFSFNFRPDIGPHFSRELWRRDSGGHSGVRELLILPDKIFIKSLLIPSLGLWVRQKPIADDANYGYA